MDQELLKIINQWTGKLRESFSKTEVSAMFFLFRKLQDKIKNLFVSEIGVQP